MVLLEVCMHGVISQSCAEYLVDFFVEELDDNELVLCIISNNMLLDRILKIKQLTFGPNQIKKNNDKFKELMISINNTYFDF